MRAGFIGLGNIGKPLASHLAPAGFETTVFDLDEAPVRELVAGGAAAARSAREVAERADVIGIGVPEDRHVRAVMNGARRRARRRQARHRGADPQHHPPSPAFERIEASSAVSACSMPASTVAQHLAREAACTYMVGGDAALLEQARPFLEELEEDHPRRRARERRQAEALLN